MNSPQSFVCRSAVVMVMFVYLAGPSPTSAQSTAVTAGFLEVNVGIIEPSSNLLAQKIGEGGATVEVDYDIPRRLVFDLAGGVLLGQRFGVSVAVSHNSKEQPATIRVGNVFVPGFKREIAISPGHSDPLQHSETAIHLDGIYRVPVAIRGRVELFGGPSFFSVNKRLVTVFGLEGTSPTSLAVARIHSQLEHASAWGFNLGADYSYFFVNAVGVGGLVRYSRSTVILPNLIQRLAGNTVNEDLNVGGLLVGGGLRLRF